MAGFSWLHLSDIHFGHGTTKYGIDQAILLERLADDAVRQVSSGAVVAPNCIIVTGDIGNTGAGRDNTEYENGEEWIRALAERLAVRPERVLFTPGNHDANRGVEMSARFPRRLLDALRYGACPVDDAIANGEEAALLASRFANYRALVERLGGPAGQADPVTQFWDWHVPLDGGLSLRLTSFNSALLAAGDDDEGRLQFGNHQIRAAFGVESDSGRITMMLTHHPFSWLSDGAKVDQFARERGGIHLSGHLHVQEAEQSTRAGQNTLIRIAAGAVHGDESGDQQHAYNFGAIDITDGWATVTIFPRVFNGASFVRHSILCDTDANSSTSRR